MSGAVRVRVTRPRALPKAAADRHQEDDRDRGADYEGFLKQHFAKVTVVRRDGFDPTAARDADVVLLDWPQSEGRPSDKTSSPLGKFEEWSKPTVLLGSAGLLLAGQWQLIGGAG